MPRCAVRHLSGLLRDGMRTTGKALIMLFGIAAMLLLLGFFVFAGVATQRASGADEGADGIVVLTGAEFRIAEGARLLQEKKGNRLLITGVNPRVTRSDLSRITGLPDEQLECCVDVDTKALDTIGNAREARAWIRKHGYSSIILVTSNFHMPRSTTEFAIGMPHLRILPHPVVPRGFPTESWWLHAGTARILLSEYLKFLPTALRLATDRVVGPWQSSAIAVTGGKAPSQARL